MHNQSYMHTHTHPFSFLRCGFYSVFSCLPSTVHSRHMQRLTAIKISKTNSDTGQTDQGDSCHVWLLWVTRDHLLLWRSEFHDPTVTTLASYTLHKRPSSNIKQHIKRDQDRQPSAENVFFTSSIKNQQSRNWAFFFFYNRIFVAGFTKKDKAVWHTITTGMPLLMNLIVRYKPLFFFSMAYQLLQWKMWMFFFSAYWEVNGRRFKWRWSHA